MIETTSPSALKSAMPFGILFGVIITLQLVISYTMNIDPTTNKAYGYTINVLNYLVLPVAFIYLACKSFKTANQGFMAFGQCLKVGVLVCLIAALISTVIGTVLNMIYPEYMESIMSHARDAMINENPEMTEEQIEMGISMMKKFTNPAIMIPVALLMYSFIGLIYSLIVGAIVKKDRPASFQ